MSKKEVSLYSQKFSINVVNSIGDIEHHKADKLYSDRIKSRFNNKVGYHLNSLSKNSQTAFNSDTSIFIQWCKEHNFCALPVHEEVLRVFLIEQAKKLSPKTVDRRLTSISTLHKILGLKNPREEPEVYSTIRAIYEDSDYIQKQAQPFRLKDICIIPYKIQDDKVKDIRDVAITLIAYEALLRISEVARIKVKDIKFNEYDGSGILNIEYVKGRKGEKKAHCAYLTENCCSWIKKWLSASEIKEGYLFRKTNKWNKVCESKLSSESIADSINRMGRLIDSNFKFTGHSTRVGAAQDMIANNIELSAAMQAGRWNDYDTFFNYTKHLNAKETGMAQMLRKNGIN